MTEKFAEKLRQAIIDIAGARLPVDTRESWLRRAARRAGITYGEAKRLFYRETPNPRASLVERVRAAVAKKNQEKEAAIAKAYEELDYQELGARIELLERRLAEISAQLARVNLPGSGEVAALIGAWSVTSD